jgi:CarD family transcriptional regulator
MTLGPDGLPGRRPEGAETGRSMPGRPPTHPPIEKGGSMFEIGDKAVYPGHGVGVIEAIERKQILGKDQIFYILRVLENGMTIMVPRDNAEAVGLRGIIQKLEIPKVLHILKAKDVAVDTQTWNRRYREYMEKINTGSIYEIAEVLRDLHLLKEEKELSFGERKILDVAKNLLVKELAVARDVKETDILKEIKHILGA